MLDIFTTTSLARVAFSGVVIISTHTTVAAPSSVTDAIKGTEKEAAGERKGSLFSIHLVNCMLSELFHLC
jgi:hypothetical protein